MRNIGQLAKKIWAERIGDYLYLHRIENTIHPEEDGTWSLWIHDDNQMLAAGQILLEFQQNPEADKFKSAETKADRQRSELQRLEASSRSRQVDVRTTWRRPGLIGGTSRLTLALIIICVAVALVSQLGANREILRYLFIADYQTTGAYISYRVDFAEVLHGQIWRLITPIFIHFGFLHLIFNMMWLKDLGSMIELRQSSFYLAALVLVIGVFSNVAQFLMDGPTFGGMSGVVYGLLGYIWIRGKRDPRSGLYLHKNIVVWMLIWFALCWTGLIGNVANMAHTVGLLVGIVWGYLASLGTFRKRIF